MIAIDNKLIFKRWLRLVFGILSGILGGWLLLGSFDVGVRNFLDKADEANNLFNDYDSDSIANGVLLWGDHWFIRLVVSLICTYWGAFLGGLISRSKGKIIGIITSVPTSILWFAFLFLSLYGDIEISISLSSKLMSGALIIGSLFAGYLGGEEGQNLSFELAEHFDTRKYSLLGIKWYHYLWIPIPLHLILMQLAWAVMLILSNWWSYSWMSTLFFIPIYASVYVTVWGCHEAYLILSGMNDVPQLTKRFTGVLKFGCLFPLLGILLSSLPSLFIYGFSYLFR